MTQIAFEDHLEGEPRSRNAFKNPKLSHIDIKEDTFRRIDEHSQQAETTKRSKKTQIPPSNRTKNISHILQVKTSSRTTSPNHAATSRSKSKTVSLDKSAKKKKKKIPKALLQQEIQMPPKLISKLKSITTKSKGTKKLKTAESKDHSQKSKKRPQDESSERKSKKPKKANPLGNTTLNKSLRNSSLQMGIQQETSKLKKKK